MPELEIAHCYRKYSLTMFLENDIKSIKRINIVYGRFLKSKKVTYILEIINILTILNNTIDIIKCKQAILSYIDLNFRYKVESLIDNLQYLDCRIIRDNLIEFEI